MSRGAILAVPACAPGLGGGHLVRCMALVRDLRGLGREAMLFLPDGAGSAAAKGLLSAAHSGAAHFDPAWIACENGLREKSWACVILDRCRTPPEECRRWTALAPAIAIDEGGPCRGGFDFLIDILPGASRIRPNICDPSLLPLPKKFRPKDGGGFAGPQKAPLKALISFGQEDAAGLGLAAALALSAALDGKSGESLEATLLIGALGTAPPEPGSLGRGIRVMEKLPNLSERLREYDLAITHFGLTAFEALYAGVPALLISPTAHHEKVAQKAGFFSLGIGKGSAKKLARLLLKNGSANHAFLRSLKARSAALAARHNVSQAPRQSLAELASSFAPDIAQSCAACAAALLPPPLARFAERSYRRCKRCGAITMNRISPPPIEYAREYFFEFYRQQYGKTYIEDFPHLRAMAKQRLARIRRLLPAGKPSAAGVNSAAANGAGPAAGAAPRLLEIGCAYGPFLAEARDGGFAAQGLEPAEDAANYVAQTLGIPAMHGFFKKGLFGAGEFDAVALWLVIEHFRDGAEALAEIRRILKPGGALAFSTPSLAGISGRSSLSRFLERSPADHWTVWSPAACRKALAAAGFRLKKIRVTGHHPERFPLLGKCARGKKGPLYLLLLAASRLFALGDTFEAYAVKESSRCKSVDFFS